MACHYFRKSIDLYNTIHKTVCSTCRLCVINYLWPAASHEVFRNGINLIFHLHLLLAVGHNFNQKHPEVGPAEIESQEFTLLFEQSLNTIRHISNICQDQVPAIQTDAEYNKRYKITCHVISRTHTPTPTHLWWAVKVSWAFSAGFTRNHEVKSSEFIHFLWIHHMYINYFPNFQILLLHSCCLSLLLPAQLVLKRASIQSHSAPPRRDVRLCRSRRMGTILLTVIVFNQSDLQFAVSGLVASRLRLY